MSPTLGTTLLALLATGCTTIVGVPHRYPTSELRALDGYDVRNQARYVPTQVATTGLVSAVSLERIGVSHRMVSDRGRMHDYDGTEDVLELITPQGRVGGKMKSLRVTPSMIEGETTQGSLLRYPLAKVHHVEVIEHETSYTPAIVLGVLILGAVLAADLATDEDGEE